MSINLYRRTNGQTDSQSVVRLAGKEAGNKSGKKVDKGQAVNQSVRQSVSQAGRQTEGHSFSQSVIQSVSQLDSLSHVENRYVLIHTCFLYRSTRPAIYDSCVECIVVERNLELFSSRKHHQDIGL